MKRTFVCLAITGALLVCTASRASATPVFIGTFSWDDLGMPNFVVTNDSADLAQPYDFLSLVVHLIYFDTTTEDVTLYSISGSSDVMPFDSAAGGPLVSSDQIQYASLNLTLDSAITPTVSDLTSPFTTSNIYVDVPEPPAPVPEPGSWLLVLTGLATAGLRRARRARR